MTMIQLRWKKLTQRSQGLAVEVEVDGQLCVLQYRLNFIPTTRPELGEAIVLKEPRPIDNEWRDVKIDEFNWDAEVQEKYELAKPARPTCPHNQRAWARMQPLLGNGPAALGDLMRAIGTHKPPPSRETGDNNSNCLNFILYCVRRGWLRAVL